MDVVASSRAYFAMPSPSPEQKISLAASSTVYTYHCLCSHLLLATSTPLPALPRRKNTTDEAHIMPLPPPPAPARTSGRGRSGSPSDSKLPPSDHYGLLLSTRLDAHPVVVTSDDGFEKRYLQRCGRCNLVVGYQLDWQQFSGDEQRVGRRDDLAYLLAGGFVTTSEMIMGKATNPISKAAGISMVSATEVKA